MAPGRPADSSGGLPGAPRIPGRRPREGRRIALGGLPGPPGGPLREAPGRLSRCPASCSVRTTHRMLACSNLRSALYASNLFGHQLLCASDIHWALAN